MVLVNQEFPSTATCKHDQARAKVAAGTATAKKKQREKEGTVTLTPTSGRRERRCLSGANP